MNPHDTDKVADSDVACKEFVALITAYLDGACPPTYAPMPTSTSTCATAARTCSPNGAPNIRRPVLHQVCRKPSIA
jgi:hypothetical protein